MKKNMKQVMAVGVLILLFSGCLTTRPDPILTSKEESWYIPANTEFQAKKKPEETLKTYKAEEDLMVLHLGTYLELERKANSCAR